MSTSVKLIVGVVLLATSFACGRWLAPTKIKTETKIVYKEKSSKKTETDKDIHKETTITETVTPDGTHTRVTKVIEDSNKKTETKEKDSKEAKQKESKEITRATDKVTISALGAIDFTSPSGIIYGGSVSKPILGPIAVGVFGLQNGVGGVSLGLSF